MLARDVGPVLEFLGQYSKSPLAAKAVDMVDAELTGIVAPYADDTVEAERSPAEGWIESYQETAERLPPPLRARASEAIADLWVKLRRYDKARPLYEWLLATPQTGADTAAVRQRVLALPKPGG